MIHNKRVLAIIPARTGSKRVINKNIRDLGGLPLIGWTLKDLHKSRYIDYSYVSTDSHEIQQVAKAFDIDADPLRPSHLATDLAKSIDVVLDVVNRLKTGFDIIVLLQPTSPLRTIEDVDQALEYFIEKSAHSVTSVCEVESHPSWSSSLPMDMNMTSMIKKLSLKRSQDLEKYYRLNGAIYISSCDEICRNESLFADKKAYAFVLPRIRSIDIDTEEDFTLAEAVLLQMNKVSK